MNNDPDLQWLANHIEYTGIGWTEDSRRLVRERLREHLPDSVPYILDGVRTCGRIEVLDAAISILEPLTKTTPGINRLALELAYATDPDVRYVLLKTLAIAAELI